jgi:hypothetical protein
MSQNLTNDEIILKILDDSLFKSSDKYKMLLEYLYKCYVTDKVPTEFDIAADVFYKDKDFNPAEDTTVRVYIYRLRKKLDDYYESTGKHDSIAIQIQKGTYHIEFIKRSELNKRKILEFKQYLYYALVIFLLLVITFLTIEFFSLQNKLNKDDVVHENKLVWSDFINNGLPTLYCVGSLYAYYYYMEQFDRSWLVRDDAINNEMELNAFTEKYHLDKNNISVPDWKIIPKSAALHFGRLLPIFHNNVDDLTLMPTDELKWSDIEDNNIIYIGHFHNLNILNTIFPNKHIYPQVQNINHGNKTYSIRVKTAEIDTLYPIVLSVNKSRMLETDYVVVSKVPGPRNNVILFICSFSSMGRLKLVETLTSAEMITELEQTVLKEKKKLPKYFEMLVKVSGFLDTGLEATVMHFLELPADFELMKDQK